MDYNLLSQVTALVGFIVISGLLFINTINKTRISKNFKHKKNR